MAIVNQSERSHISFWPTFYLNAIRNTGATFLPLGWKPERYQLTVIYGTVLPLQRDKMPSRSNFDQSSSSLFSAQRRGAESGTNLDKQKLVAWLYPVQRMLRIFCRSVTKLFNVMEFPRVFLGLHISGIVEIERSLNMFIVFTSKIYRICT